ncbi:hypothetical protein VTK73DRAFT_1539 [Phialemonium thermophilum]|uniref:Uncharacterized protein n=1 Tax=Phialemonium thermophilum TaxID=223376 RepID=A0ABR3VT98_9PEZI
MRSCPGGAGRSEEPVVWAREVIPWLSGHAYIISYTVVSSRKQISSLCTTTGGSTGDRCFYWCSIRCSIECCLVPRRAPRGLGKGSKHPTDPLSKLLCEVIQTREPVVRVSDMLSLLSSLDVPLVGISLFSRVLAIERQVLDGRLLLSFRDQSAGH